MRMVCALAEPGPLFAVSAQIMRRITVDFARAKQNLKRAVGRDRSHSTKDWCVTPESGADLPSPWIEALERLALLNASTE